MDMLLEHISNLLAIYSHMTRKGVSVILVKEMKLKVQCLLIGLKEETELASKMTTEIWTIMRHFDLRFDLRYPTLSYAHFYTVFWQDEFAICPSLLIINLNLTYVLSCFSQQSFFHSLSLVHCST
jgi:hypothetical protein